MNAIAPLSMTDSHFETIESTDTDLASLRYLLDLALQPIDQFAGFTRLEQIGSSAYRYQLNFVQYALAMSQMTRTPAFTGYLAEAQRNCILKMCERRVWRYWATENLLGNFRWNPDPVSYQNVMYTGFLGVMLGMYETFNDDRDFSHPGALALHWNKKRTFYYSYSSLTAAIQHNMQQSRYVQYACEPHLVYPMCNSFALNTLLMHDRLHNTDFTGDLVERVEKHYEKDRFIRKNGRFVGGRGPMGFAFPSFVSNDAVMALWLRAAMPEQSEKSWQLIRDHLAPLSDGEVRYNKRWINRIDFGNYTLNGAWLRTFLLALSREMGDSAYADAVENSFRNHYEIECREGASAFKGVSTWANANYALARFTRKNALQQLLSGEIPDTWRRGPLLAEAAYPDVLVAKAVTDGQGLELIIQPGCGPVTTTLGLARLSPGQHYGVSGAASTDLQADAQGKALLQVTLQHRQTVTITPILQADE